MTVVDLAVAFVIALGVSAVTTPVGVSGAVFLLPVQLSLLGVPSPAVTPTNLLYNVVATPGALMRYRAVGPPGRRLSLALLAGTLPGVVLGAWLRVEHLAGETVFRILLAALLLPLGAWLVVARPSKGRQETRPIRASWLLALGVGVGIVGGILGIGGGSVVAPVLAGLGVAMARVAPAALTVTLLTSVVGVLTFAVVGWSGHPAASPEWAVGACLGLGGLVGGYVGARIQPYVPEMVLRRALGVVALVVGTTYLI